MYLVHRSTIKNPDGVIDIDISIVDREKIHSYTYHLRSEWAVEKFNWLYKKSRKTHGKALEILNQFKIKKEKENEK